MKRKFIVTADIPYDHSKTVRGGTEEVYEEVIFDALEKAGVDVESVRLSKEHSGMKCTLKRDDIDRHGEGCSCGSCNSIGKSYGVGIYPEGADEVVQRVYGPSEDSAMSQARKVAWELNLTVVEEA